MMQGQLNMVHFIRVHNIFHISYNTDYEHPESFFFNSKLLGLGRQIGLKFLEVFGVFLAKLLALFWHCESLVNGNISLVLFPTKNFGF